MARFLLTTFGTLGDVRPFVALARGLRAAGHEVLFCGSPDRRAWLEAEGLPFHPAGDDYSALMAELEASPARASAAMTRQVPAQFAALGPLVRDADCVVSGSLEYATATLCEAAAVPRRAVLLSPAMVPSRAWPMPLLPWQGLPGWANALSWWLSDAATGASIMKPLAAERRRLGLPPAGRASRHLCGEEVWVPFPAHLLAVEAAEVSVLQLPPWLLDELEPSEDLAAWLDAGEPPLCFTLGSMPGPPVALLAEAARLVGLRALVLGEEGPTSPDLRCEPGGAPHGAVLPRCAAVVHHGGAGTLVAATQAGRPQVVLPRIADQHAHGRAVARLGLGRSLSRRGLTAEQLAAALGEALALDPAPLAAAAAAIGADGVDLAVRHLARVATASPGLR